MFNCTRRVCGLFDRARNAVSREIDVLRWEAVNDVVSFNIKALVPVLLVISWYDAYLHSLINAMYAELEAQASDNISRRI